MITFANYEFTAKCHKIKLGVLHQLLGFPLVSCCQYKGLVYLVVAFWEEMCWLESMKWVFNFTVYYIPHVQRHPFIWYSLHQKKDPSIYFLRNLKLCQKKSIDFLWPVWFGLLYCFLLIIPTLMHNNFPSAYMRYSSCKDVDVLSIMAIAMEFIDICERKVQ